MIKSNWKIQKLKYPEFNMVFKGIIIILGLAIALNSCTKDDPVPEKEDVLKITGVSIPSSIEVVAASDITITGKGFAIGDQIRLTSAKDANIVYNINLKAVTDNNATFTLPNNITSGNYKVTVVRGVESLLLGSFLINIITGTNIPNIEGMTIKGVVYSDGVGIPNVVVSDGYEVTKTDANGIYYLPSQKKHGYVFISVPGNYEVPNSVNAPQFFKKLAGGSSVEQKDFSLTPVDNKKHVVLTMADWHLANRNDDLSQFSDGILTDVNFTISNYQASGTKVYVLTLGDMTWDVYWYDNKFALDEYLPQMNKVNCTVFNLMGNHDNDPYTIGDWNSESKFKNIICPTYYSFNLGEVHYIVLDDIEYINTGGSQGVVGARNYNDIIVSDQIAWLKKDLATLTDKNTPLVIAMHSPLYNNVKLDSNANPVNSIHLSNSNEFTSSLQSFTNVHIVSGHTHINYTVEASESLTEHNTAAVSATWWWTGKNGYAGNHICKDGSPGGYGIWEMNGSDIKWYYKSSGYEKNYQFRSYDLNTVQINAANFAPNSTDAALAEYASVYANSNKNNEVLINVWGYDSKWKIEVKEAGKSLDIKRVYVMDPLHIISYEAKRLNVGATPTSSFLTGYTAHMFKATATSATSTLDITVTDRFGNIYSETMSRPKAFTYLMK